MKFIPMQSSIKHTQHIPQRK